MRLPMANRSWTWARGGPSGYKRAMGATAVLMTLPGSAVRAQKNVREEGGKEKGRTRRIRVNRQSVGQGGKAQRSLLSAKMLEAAIPCPLNGARRSPRRCARR